MAPHLPTPRRMINRAATRLIGLWAVALSIAAACGAEADMTLVSGRAIGERVPQFFVRAVTGPLMNKSVCYVCRNGDRPVVMVFLRDLVAGTPEFLTQLDRCVDQHRAAGLRGFCVLLSENQRSATSQLQTLAFDNQLSLPLTVASSQLEAPASQNLHPDAAVTIVLYQQQTVLATHAFRETELTSERITELMAGIRDMAAKAR